MAKCPNCGTEAAEGANFCAACGSALGSPAVAAMIEDARRALASRPDDASARYNLAIAYKLAGMEDRALEELREVAQLDPDFADAHYEMGLLYANSGRTQEAIAALSRAVARDPDHSRARQMLERLRAGT